MTHGNISRTPAVIMLIIMVMIGCGRISAQTNADQVLKVGQNALYFEDYILSIQYFNQVIQSKPYLAKPYLLRSIAKLNLEDYAGAEADASRAIELHPYMTDAWEVRGVARQNLGRHAEAVDDYKQALGLMPRNRQLMFNMALALETLKRYGEADTVYADLLKFNPAFDNGYLGRARLRLLQTDTVGAVNDIEKALSLNKNAVNAYIMRADIAINSEKDYKQALADMDVAIKLQPRLSGLYINRAFLRYNLDDYFGAMADYDYAIQLDPTNVMARFNRALLLAEVNANDRALEDFNAVLQLQPDDIRSLYNRSLILQAKGRYKDAVADINKVIEQFPEFPGGYGIRSELYRQMGNMRSAESDYNKAIALAKAAKPSEPRDTQSGNKEVSPDSVSDGSKEIPAELVSRRFASLLTADNNVSINEEYNNTAIRGRVQDHNLTIGVEPMILLSYYSNTDELRGATYYIKEISDVNATRMLPMTINVTNRIPMTDEDLAKRHFESINYYNSYLSTHKPRAIDYFGRAMDRLTIRDYEEALKDAELALSLTPQSAAALFLKFQALYGIYQITKQETDTGDYVDDRETDHRQAVANRRLKIQKALDDADKAIDEVLKVSPGMSVAWFDKGNLMLEADNLTSALAAYSKAIEMKPDMGEAYFNRGYVYLRAGNQKAGLEDLSKAGQHGIAAAYNLIKRISN